MRLFIRVVDGSPYEHPIVEDNFCAAFPDVDVNNLPEGFAEFIREPFPKETSQPYKVYEGSTYELLDDGKYHDVHRFRDMTTEEKLATQEKVQQEWRENGGYASFVFDETKCLMVPPKPKPNDGKAYAWDEALLDYVEVAVAG